MSTQVVACGSVLAVEISFRNFSPAAAIGSTVFISRWKASTGHFYHCTISIDHWQDKGKGQDRSVLPCISK